MSALYDSGLFDADDLVEAYANGFNAANQTMTLTITTVCPICMEPLPLQSTRYGVYRWLCTLISGGASSVKQKF